MVLTERYRAALVIKHLKAALEAIKRTAGVKPATLETCHGKLTMIEIVAGEALAEAEMPAEA